MAIVQISQITNRLGLNTDLPQLAGAELGWSTDTRQLYIGNGTLEQGAPVIGNTEVLTEFSDILNLGASYTYKGTAAGYVVQTGPTPGSPVTQSLQTWLDQWASVKDFGAKGDGLTDDTAAINRALYQLYCRQDNTQIRRSLFFPAGVYIISSSILIPPYAMLYGEGITSSIIQMIASGGTGSYVAETTDNLQQTGINIGTNGAIPPTGILIESMGFSSLDSSKAIFLAESVTNSKFTNVSFTGSGTVSTLVNDSLSTAGVNFDCSVVTTNNILFDGCAFAGTVWGVQTAQPTRNVTITNSSFTTLYQGVFLGPYPLVSGGPTGTRITNSVFDIIYAEGIVFDTVSLNATGYNTFYDVGNHFQGITNPFSSIILIQGDNNVSIGDMFQRSDAYSVNYPRVQINDYLAIATTNGSQLQLGSKIIETGTVVTLLPNQTNGNAIVFNPATNGAIVTSLKIDYSTTCPSVTPTAIRTGTLWITNTGSGTLNSMEDYTENESIGINYTVQSSGSNILVKYTSLLGPSATQDCMMRYSISYFN